MWPGTGRWIAPHRATPDPSDVVSTRSLFPDAPSPAPGRDGALGPWSGWGPDRAVLVFGQPLEPHPPRPTAVREPALERVEMMPPPTQQPRPVRPATPRDERATEPRGGRGLLVLLLLGTLSVLSGMAALLVARITVVGPT
jgi:hypothetical protein